MNKTKKPQTTTTILDHLQLIINRTMRSLFSDDLTVHYFLIDSKHLVPVCLPRKQLISIKSTVLCWAAKTKSSGQRERREGYCCNNQELTPL